MACNQTTFGVSKGDAAVILYAEHPRGTGSRYLAKP